MRIRNLVQHANLVSASNRSRGADEIPESVNRADSRVVEWRNEERACKVRGVVLDEVNSWQLRFSHAERVSERRSHIVNFFQITRPIHDVRQLHSISHREARLAEEVRARIAADCDVRDVTAGDSFELEALPYCVSRKASPMLDAAEAFLFEGYN